MTDGRRKIKIGWSERYSVEIAWCDEDGGFVAVCPELDGISAIGETRDEAFREFQVVLPAVLDVMHGDGEEFPDYLAFEGRRKGKR